MFVMIKAH